MDCHLGLKYAEKGISIVLDGDGKDALPPEEESREAFDLQFALLSTMMRPHAATIMTRIQQARNRHAMAILAWQVMDYRRRHDGTLPESLADKAACLRWTGRLSSMKRVNWKSIRGMMYARHSRDSGSTAPMRARQAPLARTQGASSWFPSKSRRDFAPAREPWRNTVAMIHYNCVRTIAKSDAQASMRHGR